MVDSDKISPSVKSLLEKGVKIRCPWTVDIGEEVNIERISSKEVTIYPGCRIYGEKTVICEGVTLGKEGPVTLVNCQVGKNVELKGGYFFLSVFLDNSTAGFGSHVREACILEEYASCAHCVGLKHTILFPFVTLGSLINFCDCLMAGGTGKKNHSEVGSSYIHFNFTPYGHKATASLIGDVPRGVMLRERPIFLGGQGGLVGPSIIGFGNVVAAGSIIRQDILIENKLIYGKAGGGRVTDFYFKPDYGLKRVVLNNIYYIGNLLALILWYKFVRKEICFKYELGEFLYEGAIEKLKMAVNERIKRLEELAGLVKREEIDLIEKDQNLFQKEFCDGVNLLYNLVSMNDKWIGEAGSGNRQEFLEYLLRNCGGTTGLEYTDIIKNLSSDVASKGTDWLEEVVTGFQNKVFDIIPSLRQEKERI